MAKGKKTNEKGKKGSSSKKNIRKLDGIAGLDSEIWGKILIVVIVLVVLGLFYLLTLYITQKNSDSSTNKESKDKTETTISYENIILGRSFDMSDDDYLVIYYDNSDEEVSSVYSGLLSTYKGKEDAMNVYSVDMSSAFNKGFSTTEESNKNPTNSSELSINGPTLIHFSNHAVSEYIEGEEAITNYLS